MKIITKNWLAPLYHSNAILRYKYDESIAYTYNLLSRGIFPEELPPSENTPSPPPHHVQLLAKAITNTKAFRNFADFVRFVYRTHKNTKTIFRKTGDNKAKHWPLLSLYDAFRK